MSTTSQNSNYNIFAAAEREQKLWREKTPFKDRRQVRPPTPREEPGLRILITLMQIRIQFLFKVMGICEH
jgi:hypothetical protein